MIDTILNYCLDFGVHYSRHSHGDPLATGKIWKDQDGKQQERTEWHRVVFYRCLAEITAEFLKKGSKMDIFKKPMHVVPMWIAALVRSVETVWPTTMEIQHPRNAAMFMHIL